jgi:hypothetical protein
LKEIIKTRRFEGNDEEKETVLNFWKEITTDLVCEVFACKKKFNSDVIKFIKEDVYKTYSESGVIMMKPNPQPGMMLPTIFQPGGKLQPVMLQPTMFPPMFQSGMDKSGKPGIMEPPTCYLCLCDEKKKKDVVYDPDTMECCENTTKDQHYICRNCFMDFVGRDFDDYFCIYDGKLNNKTNKEYCCRAEYSSFNFYKLLKKLK